MRASALLAQALECRSASACSSRSENTQKWRWKSQHALAEAMCSLIHVITVFQVVIEGIVLTGTIKSGRHGTAVVM